MKKIVFNDEKCYIVYKGFFKENLLNFQKNFTYEKNFWYESLDVDMSECSCSYGLNLFQTIEEVKEFFSNRCLILKCFVPLKNNKIKFFKNKDKFRCQRFFLSDDVVYNSTTYSDVVCINYTPYDDFRKEDWFLNPEKYWKELTGYQINLICQYNQNFDVDNYWNGLTCSQKNLICEHNQNFNIEKYWCVLTEFKKDLICEYNLNFNYKKHWSELTEYQINLLKTKVVIKKKK